MKTQSWSKILTDGLRALAVGAVSAAMLQMLFAAVFYFAAIPGRYISMCAGAVCFLAALAGGIVMASGGKRRRLLWGLGYGALFFGVLLLLSFVFEAKGVCWPEGGWKSLLICLAGGAVGGIVS